METAKRTKWKAITEINGRQYAEVLIATEENAHARVNAAAAKYGAKVISIKKWHKTKR